MDLLELIKDLVGEGAMLVVDKARVHPPLGSLRCLCYSYLLALVGLGKRQNPSY